MIETAKLAVHNHGSDLSKYIKNYGIDASSAAGQQGLIEIAKLSAQQHGWETSECIENYGIDPAKPEGQIALIEIAKLAAQQNGWGTSVYIKNYGIDPSTTEGQKALIEIAQLAVQRQGGGASAHIQNYGIDKSTPEGKQALLDIARLAAYQNGMGTSQYIKNYGIERWTTVEQELLANFIFTCIAKQLPSFSRDTLQVQFDAFTMGLVLDDQGKILARSVFRLLIDSRGQPVLFQEKVYVADSKPEYPRLLRKLALKKAANLEIPLVVSRKDFENDPCKIYPYAVHAKQKPVPFEYVDALNGIQDRDYVIQNPLQVYAPQSS